MQFKWKLPCLSGGSGGQETVRHVFVNQGHPHEDYLGNYTRTTKYTLLTFLPKALYEQYRRIANIYFTVVAALSLTEFSPVRPWTTWLPLAFVLGVAMIKEAREDYKRHKEDNEVNNRHIDVLDPASGHFVWRKWQDVKVGDIIMVKKNHFFPADLLFLTAENEEGTCYVETMNLDGETNLKIKKALDETKEYTHDTLKDFKAGIECEPPNSRLYQFMGNLLLALPLVPEDRTVPVNPATILLRGCALRNTERVFGAVIYAGHESKVFKNAMVAPSKRSHVERIIDKIILGMFALLFAFSITGCVYFAFWTTYQYPNQWYLHPSVVNVQYNSAQPVLIAVTNFVTVFILYGYLIPISLYVTVEIVKICQSIFINCDRDMYHAETDTPALARTSNLNEELGMVNTILSDKTGTLTRNVMEFFKCSIAGVSYGQGVTEIEHSNAKRHGVILDTMPSPEALKYRERFFNFYDARMMDGAWLQTAADPQIIEMFWRLLAVCHTIIPDGPMTPEEIKYLAESPDEAALVVGAKVMGFFFFRRTNTTITVRETTRDGTRDVEYEVLSVLEFNSTRKRMSVIVRDDTGKVIIFCKGADTVIYERLDIKHPQNEALKATTTQHMEEYGSAGLRTLCLAYAEVDPAFYATWQEQWIEAKTSLEGRDEKLAECAELVEKNMRLLGCTAIEDKLQEGVPQCIKQLAIAGIRLWVLTGDKMETAINIGFACSLLTEEMDQFIISAYTPELDALEAAGRHEEATKLGHERIADSLAKIEQEMKSHHYRGQYAIIIDGKALSFALSQSLSQLFLRVGLRCAAVLCCRVSPLQKAQVTALVRSYGDTTLAIGDGANDVGMIQKAHIGVGISGQEGMQAAMSADFAVAQFRFLTPLLLVHGRWSYKRLSRMVNFFFFKNLLFGTTLFCFNAMAVFSGQYIYNDFYMSLYNVVFTSLTPCVIGIWDRDVDKKMSLRFPTLYKQGQRNQYLSGKAIAGWLTSSLFQCAVVMTLIMVGCNSLFIGHANGQPFGMFETGIYMFSVVMLTVHFQVVQIIEHWTFLHHIAIWLSTAVWWLLLLVFGIFSISISGDLYYIFVGVVAPNAQYWLYLLLVPMACQLPDFFWRQARRHLFPEEHHILQELAAKERRNRAAVASLVATGPLISDPNDSMIVSPHEKRQIKNKGWVPPYCNDSKFYSFRNEEMGDLQQASALHTTASGAPPETTIRNPVLSHLDQELATVSARHEQQGVGAGSSSQSGVAQPAPSRPSGKAAVMPAQNGAGSSSSKPKSAAVMAPAPPSS